MRIERFVVGQLQENCYIVYDEEGRDAMVVDPGDEPHRILESITRENLRVLYIVCTHGHFDHLGAVAELKEETGAKIVLHRDELELYVSAGDQATLWGFGFDPQPKPDLLVSEGDQLRIGRMNFSVLSTPGHSPGGMSLYGEEIVLTGDTVFAGSVGRTDLPGGDIEALKGSFKRILSLPPQTVILPGHGDATTVGRECKTNFFVHEL